MRKEGREEIKREWVEATERERDTEREYSPGFHYQPNRIATAPIAAREHKKRTPGSDR